MKNTNLKKSLVCAAALMLSAVSCSEVKGNVPVSEDISGTGQIVEQKEDIILTFAMSGYTERIDKIIKEFNEADNGYQVQIKRYFDQFNEDGSSNILTVEEYQYIDLEVLQDIMNTTNIDIVCDCSFANLAYYEILQNKGAFADLYTFMENDSEVNSDTLDMHVLSLNEIDGKLYSMPTFYNINGLYGESKYVGTKENWTFDEFMEHWNAMPPDSTLMGATDKDGVYNVVLGSNLNNFIDYENVKVNFDSPDFRRMLEFCNQFELSLADKATYNYETPSMLSPFIVTGIMNAPLFDQDNGRTCVGYPSNNGNGAYLSSSDFCYSICASSSPEKQKGAWEFIRSLLKEETQIEMAIPHISGGGVSEDYYSTEIGYCVNKNAFNSIAQKLINKEYYPATSIDKGIELDTRFPTEKEVKELRRYINSIGRWESETSGPINAIVIEEASAYFAGGQDIDTTIDHIQNRASIWISEQS